MESLIDSAGLQARFTQLDRSGPGHESFTGRGEDRKLVTISLAARDVGRQCCQSGKGTAVGACGVVEGDFSFADQHKVICSGAILRCRPYSLHRWN